MANVSVSDLRNNGGRVLERVANGESLTVTLDGRPVAELRPLPGRAIPAATLLARWRRLPRVDVAAFRADLDDAMIAATAIANQLPLYTCNPAEFSGIDGVDVVAVAAPSS